MPIREQPTDLANRMAGWFFIVFGSCLLFSALAIRSTYAPNTPVVVWVLGAIGIAATVFGIVAPRRIRASVLDAVVTFIWV